MKIRDNSDINSDIFSALTNIEYLYVKKIPLKALVDFIISENQPCVQSRIWGKQDAEVTVRATSYLSSLERGHHGKIKDRVKIRHRN